MESKYGKRNNQINLIFSCIGGVNIQLIQFSLQQHCKFVITQIIHPDSEEQIFDREDYQ